MISDRFPDQFVRYDPDRGLATDDADWGVDKDMPDDYDECAAWFRAKEEAAAAAHVVNDGQVETAFLGLELQS